MFGYKTIAIALKQKEWLKKTIEAVIDKPIQEVNCSDIKRSGLWTEYAEYCTLKSILDIYINTVIVEKF